MNIETLREHCISKKGTTEDFPFGEQTLVFKVMGKMFALTNLDNPGSVNLKCDPEYALELRDEHPDDITAGFHMNKKHWNTVSILGHLSDSLIKSLIDHSYDLVVNKLKKTDRQLLEQM